MAPFRGAAPPPGPIPVYLAAVNEKMAEVAGEVADGVVGHPMTSPDYVKQVLRPAIERGTRSAGRDPGDVSVTTNLIVQVAADGNQARQEAAYQVAFYATTRTYRPVLALHGFEDLIDPLREAHGRGDLEAMGETALPMVGTLAVGGTPDEVREHVGTFEGLADRVILGGAWIGPSRDRVQENFRLLLDTFGDV
jgi:alkanesulfonate monooxygenase SsuD/methylene tetrahydromethanopterin reductase-like flavin-dependent oxidoreductase (luciferase family)